MTDEQFLPIFEFLDVDKDGSISYCDFVNSAGIKSFPNEKVYFR